MTQEEFDKAFEALPLPTPGPPPPGISYHAAIEASYIHLYIDIISDVAYDIVPDIMDKEAAGIIITSEAILNQYASKHYCKCNQ